MLRPNKTSSSLTPITTVPSVDMVNTMLANAAKGLRVPIELEMTVNGRTFMLSVLKTGAEPRWTLYSADRGVLWETGSADPEMVANMVAAGVDQVMTMIGGAGGHEPQTTTQSFAQQAAPGQAAAATGGVVLAGEIAKVELSNVIQSVVICRMTGRLVVNCQLETVELYFEDGNLVHALLSHALKEDNETGDAVILELLMWDEGDFTFQPGVKTGERSAKRRVDSLLMEGATLADHRNYLKTNGLHLDAMLQKYSWISEQEFDVVIAKGIPAKSVEQKRIYCDIDGSLRLEDVIKRHGLPRRDWIPILFNLLSLELVCLPHNTAGGVPAFGYDERDVDNAWNALMTIETHVLPRGLFMHLFQQEFARAEKCATAKFTVCVFDIVYNDGTGCVKIPTPVAREVLGHLQSECSAVDLVGQFYGDGFAMLLPFEEANYAVALAQRFIERVHRSQSDTPLDLKNIRVAIGAATAPFDSSDPEMLLRYAHNAKEKAAKENKLIELAANL